MHPALNTQACSRPELEEETSYDLSDADAPCAVFLRTKERFGGLSNMAGGFPLNVNNKPIRTSEALYQACRYPNLPEIQKLIIGQRSPMSAKMKAKPHKRKTRPDWDERRIEIMDWCLHVKLAQNWHRFSKALLETRNMPIVEASRRDPFWGATPTEESNWLRGRNVLGKLLTRLRERIKEDEIDPDGTPNGSPARFASVLPLEIENFRLLGEPIQKIVSGDCERSGPNVNAQFSFFESNPHARIP